MPRVKICVFNTMHTDAIHSSTLILNINFIAFTISVAVGPRPLALSVLHTKKYDISVLHTNTLCLYGERRGPIEKMDHFNTEMVRRLFDVNRNLERLVRNPYFGF